MLLLYVRGYNYILLKYFDTYLGTFEKIIGFFEKSWMLLPRPMDALDLGRIILKQKYVVDY